MFEITPKELLLKNVRKGLVQPLPNKYPLLNFEKQVVKNTLLRTDENFISQWIEKGYFFAVYNGNFDLMQQLRALCETYKLGVPGLEDKHLKALFEEHGIPFLPTEQAAKTIISSFAKLEITSNTLYFSSELHPIKHFGKCENLIIFGKASQIESPDNNKYFSELMGKNDLKVQLPVSYFERYKFVFLFIEE